MKEKSESMEGGTCTVDGLGEFRDINSFCFDYGLYHNDLPKEGCIFSKCQQEEQQQESFLDFRFLDDINFNGLPSSLPPVPAQTEKVVEIQSAVQGGVEPNEQKNQYPFSLASVELLKCYGKDRKRLSSERIIEPRHGMQASDQELSTEEIMRIAGARFIQSSTRKIDVAFMLNNPFGLSFSGLSYQETQNVELAQLLLASAEKVGNQQFDRASRLLNQCESLSFKTGNPVQRLVYYFAEALRKRIDRETGRKKSQEKWHSFDVDEAVTVPNSTIQACHQAIPFYQAAHLAGLQAIIDNVSKARKIHVIDLKIRNGLQWTILMQALASQDECPLELLKITAVATTSKKFIEGTGNRLMSFAQTMNIPFSFKTIMVSDMLDLKKEHFELDSDEVVAFYSEYSLKSLLVHPDRLDSIMEVIKDINPSTVVVIEIEGNHNSPIFVNRFIETLFYFSAYFDCIDACMDCDDPNRMMTESIYLGEGIRNIVAAEGEGRVIRNVKIGVWRRFFAHFGMVETELSESSMFQAKAVINKFARGRYCTVDRDENSLIIGWKGTPILSLSAWKFSPQITMEPKKFKCL